MAVLLHRYGHLTVSNLAVSPEYQLDNNPKRIRFLPREARVISLELADPDPPVLGQRGELQPALEHLIVAGPDELGPGVRVQAAAHLPHPLAGPLPLAVTGLVNPSK